MKFLIVAIFLLGSVNSFSKTRVAVSTFKDKTGNMSNNCRLRWFNYRKLGSGMKDQIATALLKTKKVSVVERENLRQMHNEEHNLINADKSTQPRKNKFKAAHYSITGAVTEFELCSAGTSGGLDVGGLIGLKGSGLKVGGGKSSAQVVIDIRVVDTETGEVIESFESRGESSKMGFKLGGHVKGAGFNTGSFKASPIGKATRMAINKAVKKIVNVLPEKSDVKLSKKSIKRSAKSRRVSSKARSKGIRKSSSRVSHVCQVKGFGKFSKHAGCKVLGLSKTGTRVRVINLATGKKIFLKKNQVFSLAKFKSEPKIGADLMVKSEALGCSTCRKNKYAKCTLVDGADSSYILNCSGNEYEASLDDMFKVNKFNRSTASK